MIIRLSELREDKKVIDWLENVNCRGGDPGCGIMGKTDH